jgi:hypothetical protein
VFGPVRFSSFEYALGLIHGEMEACEASLDLVVAVLNLLPGAVVEMVCRDFIQCPNAT